MELSKYVIVLVENTSLIILNVMDGSDLYVELYGSLCPTLIFLFNLNAHCIIILTFVLFPTLLDARH